MPTYLSAVKVWITNCKPIFVKNGLICTFSVVQRLCASHRQHRVDGVLLRVSPYYQCENGAVWDMSLHIAPVPKPVNIQILPDQLEFVKK